MNVKEKISTPPSQIFVGTHDNLIAYTIKILQKQFCKKNGCLACIVCKQIEAKQHYSMLWLEPEKQYTREILTPIFNQISFSLEPEQAYFFVLQKANSLTSACANSLLKSVEEPPPGYHFIFLTEQEQQIIPTIRSRSVTHFVCGGKKLEDSQLIDIFKEKLSCTASTFDKILYHQTPNERKTIEIVDDLLAHWISKNKNEIKNKTNTKLCKKMISILKQSLKNPPMPGSSKIFWRNFYLQVRNL